MVVLVAFAGSPHQLSINGNDAFDLFTDLLYPIAKDKFEEFRLDDTEELVEGVMLGMETRFGVCF